MKNWQTSLFGLLTVLLPVVLQYFGFGAATTVLGAAIPAGVGLHLAQDKSAD